MIALYHSLTDWGEDVTHASSLRALPLEKTPDLYLVVVDGYGGLVSMENDFGIEEPLWAETLAARGFEVPRSSWSAYSSTTGSLPSLLNMSYPVRAGFGMSASTVKQLYSVIGGDNILVEILDEAGYTITMIESGWSGSACGPDIDVCVESPLLDEATFTALEGTILRPYILASTGYSFTVGAQRSMNWLLENGNALSKDDKPDFVFGHLMAPHPPFFLNRQWRNGLHA